MIYFVFFCPLHNLCPPDFLLPACLVWSLSLISLLQMPDDARLPTCTCALKSSMCTNGACYWGASMTTQMLSLSICRGFFLQDVRFLKNWGGWCMPIYQPVGNKAGQGWWLPVSLDRQSLRSVSFHSVLYLCLGGCRVAQARTSVALCLLGTTLVECGGHPASWGAGSDMEKSCQHSFSFSLTCYFVPGRTETLRFFREKQFILTGIPPLLLCNPLPCPTKSPLTSLKACCHSKFGDFLFR